MPIRPEWRHLYRGKEYQERRASILARAGNRCEQCQVPDRIMVQRGPAGTWYMTAEDGYLFYGWRTATGGTVVSIDGPLRVVRIVLTVAHLNHDPRDNREENLKALCQWCHLNYDKLHHAETRAVRKDAARPLLAGVA